jgi:hypothetical protein
MTVRMMRNAKGSAQSVWTVAIVKIEGSIPVRLKKRLVETPMLTPGMKSGNNITVTIRRGIPKLLTAWAAASPNRGAVIPTIAASKTEFVNAPTSVGSEWIVPKFWRVMPPVAGSRMARRSGGSSGA